MPWVLERLRFTWAWFWMQTRWWSDLPKLYFCGSIRFLIWRPNLFVDSRRIPGIWISIARGGHKDPFAQDGQVAEAIIPVHLYGIHRQDGRDHEIAGRYRIPVLEDAEALGSNWWIEDVDLANWRFLSMGIRWLPLRWCSDLSHRRKSPANKFTLRRLVMPSHYQHTRHRLQLWMSNICAGIGRGQMLSSMNLCCRRRAIHSLYGAA